MNAITYQLVLTLDVPLELLIGRLGRFYFPTGMYIYTGSAKTNPEARIRRHLAGSKRMWWHIDYLTVQPDVRIMAVRWFDRPECYVNQQIDGSIIIPGFGASDCENGCGSHLKYIPDGAVGGLSGQVSRNIEQDLIFVRRNG